jgi:MarR family transcriptional regulator, temperature-dependent positive regulator of motility
MDFKQLNNFSRHLTNIWSLIKMKADHLMNIEDKEVSIGLLVSMIHRTHMKYLNNRIKKLDITAGQFPFLMVLFNKEGITQDEIAAHVQVDKGTVARALKKLEENNYLYRAVDLNNRRRYLIRLTDKGKSIVPKILAIDNEWENFLCNDSYGSEYHQIHAILKNLAYKSLEKFENNGELY